MPPTIQTNLNAERDKRPQRPGERRSELVCRVKYCNTLPDIPFDPKFITYPFDSTRFIQYNPTSLERNYKYEVLTEHDLGVTIDLINKDTYSGELGAQLDPADEKLLEEDVLTPQDSKRSRHHARSVSWLRRTEYISTEQTRFQPQTMDKVEAKVGYSIKKNFKDETLYMDRDSQIKAIEKTFEDSKKTIEKHYSKPNVVPVEVLPVYPDFKIWKYPCAQVIFDSDPAPTGRSVPAQIEEMSQAMIRGVMDESGEQFVAYFLPTEETLEKRRLDFSRGMDYEDDEEYEYKMAREYNWNVKSKASKGYEENYFLVMRQDGIYYNELETRVRLSKRRQKAGQQPNNTRLVVKHRPLSGPEHRMQRYREKQLEPPGEEDEEEDEEEEAPQASKSKDDEASQKDGDEDGEGDGDAERDGEEDGEGEGERDDEDENKSDAEEGSEKGSADENGDGDKSEEEGSGKEKSDSEGGGSGSDDQEQDGEEAGEGEEEEGEGGEAEAGEEGEGEGGGGEGEGEGGEGDGDEEGDASGGEGSGSDGSRSSSPASRRSKSGSRSPASGSGDNRSSESGSESSSGSGSDSDNEKE